MRADAGELDARRRRRRGWRSRRPCNGPPSMTLLEKMTLSPTAQSWPTWELARKAQRSPTLVRRPPPSVPGLMVTPSRIMQSDADVERRRLAAHISGPAAGGRWRRRGRSACAAPIVVRPASDDVAHELDAVAELDLGADRRRTGRSSRPRRALRPSSTTAVGWMNVSWMRPTSSFGHQHGADLGLGDDLARRPSPRL